MEKYKHRLLGVCVLFLMAALTVGTTVSFAGDDPSSSYVLMIKKIFDTGTPGAAEDQEYIFRVEAQVKSGDGYEPVEKIVRIKGEGEKPIGFDNAFKISVIEQTNPAGFNHNGATWNVTNTVCESSMHVGASQATVNISRDGGTIQVTRPEGSPDVMFRLTGEPFHDGSGLAQDTDETSNGNEDLGEAEPTGLNKNMDVIFSEAEVPNTPETEDAEGDKTNESDEPKDGASEGEQSDIPEESKDGDHEGEQSDVPEEPEDGDHEGEQSDASEEPKDGDPGGDQSGEPSEPKNGGQDEDQTVESGKDIQRVRKEALAEIEPIILSEKDSGNDNDFNFSGATVPVKGGQTVVLGDNLPRGKYTITKLRSADGFNVLVGSRDFDVGAGEMGQVYINGSDSKITINAPGVAADGRIHHYQISRDRYTTREIDVPSGGKAVVEHLDEGLYTIKVSETYDGFKGYTIEYPYLEETSDRTGKTSALTTESTGIYKSFSVKNNADCVEVYGFGPMLDASGKSVSGTYMFFFGTRNPETGKIASFRTTVSDPKSESLVLKQPVKLAVPDSDGKVYFLVLNVSNPNAKYLTVKWREYKEKEGETIIDKPLSNGNTIVVNGLTDNYLTISKAPDENPRSKEVKYYYTIQDSDHNLITDFTVIGIDGNGNTVDIPTNETLDGETTTVTLKAGQKVKISGLKAGGNYRIYESIEEAPAMPFHVTLEDTQKSVRVPEGSMSITTLDARTVEISRPGNSQDDGGRLYTYNIYKNGEAKAFRTITLRAGEKKTVAEATGEMLPAGTYRIQAMDDQIVGFDVTYTDSSSLTSDYIKNATVSFKNYFHGVKASYHVIHEYYLKNADGSYTFEGTSPVFTKNCDGSHSEGDGHYAKDVHQMEVYNGHTYTHIAEGGDAYGKVVSWPKGGTPKTLMPDTGDTVYDGTFVPPASWRPSNGSGTAEDPGTMEYDYKALTNLHFATAVPHEEGEDHDHTAQIIILRYEREATPEEEGKYNVIHEYYQRTSDGDVWEGSRELEVKNIGRLTNENRYKTYDAEGVKKELWFTPKDQEEHPYVYDGASYGRIVNSTHGSNGPDNLGNGKMYQKDDVMTSVKATPEGDQIIILRYYRSGGYRIVHEYYYREKMEGAEDSGSVEETPGGMEEIPGGGEETPEEMEPMLLALDDDQPTEDSGFNGTLTDSGGYAYDFEGNSAIDALTADLESRHDANDVTKITQFRPDGEEEQTYTYIDAVYGYCDKETGLYRVAPYMTGVTATDQEDEIIILRYCRGDVDQPETPPDKPDKPSGGGSTPTPPKDPETPAIPEKPTEPEPPTEPENPGGPDDPKPLTDPSRPTTLPDPNQPGSPNQVTIWENGVPTTYVKLWDPEKEKWVYIPETKVPTTGKGTPTTTTIPRISRVPKTGDAGGPWGALIAAALSGFGALRLPFWKKKD